MNGQIRKAGLLTTAALGALVLPAAAQFGFSVVSDPGQYARMATELQQAIREYEAIITLYQLSQQAYANMVRAATNITAKGVWIPSATSWTYPVATNTYGTTAGWTQAVNTGNAALAGYENATIPLENYSPVWGTLTSAQQNQIGRTYSSIELTDGAAVNALNQVGLVRANATATDAAIGRLAADSASNDPALNTQVGVLNQVSAAGVIAARQQQNTNQLLAALVDQQTVQAKLQRDALAETISDEIAARQNAAQNSAAVWSGTTAAHSVRLP